MFSLHELMELEERRVKDEEANARRDAETRRAKAEELRLSALAEAEARVADERRAEEARRRQTREEEVRLAAIREAELERRRILAEREASAAFANQLADQQRADALRAATQAASGARRTVSVVVGSAVVAAAALSFAYFGVIRPSYQQRELELDRARAEQADAAASARRQIDDLRRTIDDLPRSRSATKEASTEPARDEPRPTVAAKPVRPTVAPPKVETVDCAKGDPMCGIRR